MQEKVYSVPSQEAVHGFMDSWPFQKSSLWKKEEGCADLVYLSNRSKIRSEAKEGMRQKTDAVGQEKE